MSGTRIDGYTASMAQSLYDHSKTVGQMVTASMDKSNQKRAQVTDVALQQVQHATQAKKEMLRVGSMLDVFA